jgi:hypothetical protein
LSAAAASAVAGATLDRSSRLIGPPAAAVLERLRSQRRLLLGTDAAAADAIERATQELAAALSAFADAAKHSGRVDATVAADLRRELAANQAMLAGLAAGNRRARAALFGEPSLYDASVAG